MKYRTWALKAVCAESEVWVTLGWNIALEKDISGSNWYIK